MADPFTLDDNLATGIGSPYPQSGLSYERDIVPMQKRFFQQVSNTRGIRPDQANRMALDFASRMGQTYEMSQKAAEVEQVAKQRQLQYESTLFALNREREKAARERNMLQNLAPLQKELEIASSNPELDADQRIAEVGRIALKNAGLLATNPAAATAYEVARRRITEDKKTKGTLRDYISAGGDMDFLKKQVDVNALDWETTIPPNTFVSGISEADRVKRELVRNAELAKSQISERNRRERSLISFVQSNAKLWEPKSDYDEPKDAFADKNSELAVKSALEVFGGAQERQMLADPKVKPSQLVSRALELANNRLIGIDREEQSISPVRQNWNLK